MFCFAGSIRWGQETRFNAELLPAFLCSTIRELPSLSGGDDHLELQLLLPSDG